MKKKNASKNGTGDLSVTNTFIENESFLKNFLKRFFSSTEDVEDVMQDTFLKAYTAEKKQKINSPKAFLFRIARNTALKKLTRKSHKITGYIEDLDDSEVLDTGMSIEEKSEIQQKLGLFCQSALEMTPRCRRVFLLAKVYGYSYKEISAQLDISVSAIEKHVATGLKICNAYLLRVEQDNTIQHDEKLDEFQTKGQNYQAQPQSKSAGQNQS